jgi:hypothetical protein
MPCTKPFRLVIVLMLVGLVMAGCTPKAKPNQSLLDQGAASAGTAKARQVLQDIASRNQDLARELGKLPELQKKAGPASLRALENIKQYYLLDPAGFDQAFDKMNQVGLAKHRRYCAPLQAVFWLAQEKRFSKESNPINPYDLKALLDRAWQFEAEVAPEKVKSLIQRIDSAELRQEYLTELEDNPGMVLKYIRIEYISDSSPFPFGFKAKLDAMSKNPRWSDYQIVMHRLNAPELIDYYVKEQIDYANYWTIPGYGAFSYEPEYVFNNKSGDCLYISNFITEALLVNGYNARTQKMLPTRSGDSFHAVTVYEHEGKQYIIDDGKPYKSGIMPFSAYR